jgi:Fe-S cluster assembly protein SufD
MNVNEIYENKKKSFLFNDSNEFQILRKKLIEKFDLSPKNLRNNESLKHLDPNVLKFNYEYEIKRNDIKYNNNKEDYININVIDGKINNVDSNDLNKKDFLINNIDNDNNNICNKFLSFQNFVLDDYILNLNSIFLNSGYELNINENITTIIHINNLISKNNITLFQKNMISCEKNSNVLIIEEFNSDKISNNNIVNFIDIEENSNVTHLVFQNNSENSKLQFTSFANCKSNSTYKQVTINLAKSSIRNHHYANIVGEDASADLDGIFFASSNQIIDNKTQINHNFPSCKSSQRYKGILTDNSKASYLSKTYVDKEAQLTEAYQLSKGILLSDSSTFHSKPELKIYADDVKCSHGSTIGPIDKDLLFYLRSRGLNKKKSMALLLKSFFHNIISDLKNKKFVEKFNYHSGIWLKENNL